MSLSFVMFIKFIFKKKMCMKSVLKVSGMKFFQPTYTDYIAFYLVAVLPRLTTFCVETTLTLGNENSFRDFCAVCDTNYSFKSVYTLERQCLDYRLWATSDKVLEKSILRRKRYDWVSIFCSGGGGGLAWTEVIRRLTFNFSEWRL